MHPAAANPAQPPRPRGITFLEVVAAMAMLGVVAGALFGVYGFVSANQGRQQRLLGAAELANRLMLTYLDDPTGMAKQPGLLSYGGPADGPTTYRWEYTEEPVKVREIAAGERNSGRTSPLRLDRFRLITVRVWLSEQSGGSAVADTLAPSATLTRLLDPIAIHNFDSYKNTINNPEALQRYIEQMAGFAAGTGAPPPPPPRGGPRSGGGR